jgi:Fe-S-cluster containining protein
MSKQRTRELLAAFTKRKDADFPRNKEKVALLNKTNPKEVDELFHTAHEEIFEYTDCTQCANCCKTISPIITQKDLSHLAKGSGMSVSQLLREYIEMDEDGDFVFRSTPCPFLGEGNLCRVYDHRPQACREYPHTNRKKMKEILDLTLQNSLTCPAVWKMLERLKV